MAENGVMIVPTLVGWERATLAADSLGIVAPGMKADLLLLDADPLGDIRNTRSIHTVVRSGEVYGPEERRDLLGRASTSPARMRNDWR